MVQTGGARPCRRTVIASGVVQGQPLHWRVGRIHFKTRSLYLDSQPSAENCGACARAPAKPHAWVSSATRTRINGGAGRHEGWVAAPWRVRAVGGWRPLPPLPAGACRVEVVPLLLLPLLLLLPNGGQGCHYALFHQPPCRQPTRRSLAHAVPARRRLAPTAAVAPRQPAMRPLSPTDDAQKLAAGQHSQADHSSSSSSSSSHATAPDAMQQPSASRLVPMQYRGPPSGAPQPPQAQQLAASSTPARPAVPSSSGRQVGVAISSSGSGGGGGGAVVYRARVPAAAAVQGAAAAVASAPTFTSSMMVAGFDESELQWAGGMGAVGVACCGASPWLGELAGVPTPHAPACAATSPAPCLPAASVLRPAASCLANSTIRRRPAHRHSLPRAHPAPVLCPPPLAATRTAGEDAPPTGYAYSWAQESYSRRQRTLDTWSFVLTLRARLWLLDQAWSYGPGGRSEAARSARARALAAWIRERILQLGPTFIKLGQVGGARSGFGTCARRASRPQSCAAPAVRAAVEPSPGGALLGALASCPVVSSRLHHAAEAGSAPASPCALHAPRRPTPTAALLHAQRPVPHPRTAPPCPHRSSSPRAATCSQPSSPKSCPSCRWGGRDTGSRGRPALPPAHARGPCARPSGPAGPRRWAPHARRPSRRAGARPAGPRARLLRRHGRGDHRAGAGRAR